jgi:hypothetical protein
MLSTSSEPPVHALGLNDFQDGVNIRKQRLEPEVLLTGDTIHPARTVMPRAYKMSHLQKAHLQKAVDCIASGRVDYEKYLTSKNCHGGEL